MLCEGDGFTEATISYWQDGYIPGKLLSQTAKSGADGIFSSPWANFLSYLWLSHVLAHMKILLVRII